MKNLLKFLPLVLLFAACSQKPNGTYEELVSKRDSLQELLAKTELEINNVNLAISEKDTSFSDDHKVIMKKIILQKNKIVGIQKAIRTLENKLTPENEDSNNIPVAIKEIQAEPFNHYFTIFGNAEADKYGNISPEMGGKVETIYVKEGDKVEKGTLLLTLNTDAISNQISGIKTNLEFAEKTYNKQKALWDQQIGSEMQYLQAKAAKEGLEAQLEAINAQMRMSQLRAPYDGIVNKIYPKKGEMAGPSFPVIEFVNLSKITIRANVSEKYIGNVRKGQLVELTFSSLPEFKKEVEIASASKVINAKSRTFEIELKLDNSNELIKPNMVSTIRINDFSASDAIIIPSLVIKKDIAGDYVYLVNDRLGKLIVEKQQVEIGKSYQDNTMITKGLKLGDKVVVKGYNLVSTGIPVSIKN